MARLKNPYQLEYLVKGQWMPEGALIDWHFVTSVRKISVFSEKQFSVWREKMKSKPGKIEILCEFLRGGTEGPDDRPRNQ